MNFFVIVLLSSALFAQQMLVVEGRYGALYLARNNNQAGVGPAIVSASEANRAFLAQQAEIWKKIIQSSDAMPNLPLQSKDHAVALKHAINKIRQAASME